MSEKITKAALQKMSQAEIANILMEKHGVDVDPDEHNKGDLVTMAVEAQKGNEVIKPEQGVLSSPDPSLRNSERVRIIVSEDENEPDYVFLQMNCYPYQLPRGMEVSIQKPLLEALDKAVTERQRTEFDPRTGTHIVKTRLIPRFNYQIVG